MTKINNQGSIIKFALTENDALNEYRRELPEPTYSLLKVEDTTDEQIIENGLKEFTITYQDNRIG